MSRTRLAYRRHYDALVATQRAARGAGGRPRTQHGRLALGLNTVGHRGHRTPRAVPFE